MARPSRQVSARLHMDGLVLTRPSGSGASILARSGTSRLGLARRGRVGLGMAVEVCRGLAEPVEALARPGRPGADW